MNPYVIVGAGVPSLAIASRIAKIHPEAEVVILERDAELGGLYKSIDYGSFGLFDYGMHLIYETCVPEIDETINAFMPDSEWIKLAGNKKDIAGLYFNGKLQAYSPYMDLRSIDDATFKAVCGDFLLTIKNKTKIDESTAYSLLCSRFGKTLTEKFFAPVFQKLYRTALQELDSFSTRLTANDRVILFDEETILDLMKSNLLRARIAFPDQHALPPFARTNNQLALYPKKFGMKHFFDSALKKLTEQKVKVLTQAAIQSFEIKNGRVESLTFTHEGKSHHLDGIKKVFWGAGLPQLARQLGLPVGKPPTLRTSVYVNILFDRPVTMDQLYYFYCYDANFMSFRITNYESYCPSAAGERGHPVGVEFWPEGQMTADEISKKTLEELKTFGVIGDAHQVRFCKVEATSGGFPIPTRANMENIDSIRSNLQEQKLKNLVAIGGMAEKGCFYIPDVLRDAFSKIE